VKVLAVIDALNFGGAENLLCTLARLGPRHDLELEVLSLAPGDGTRAVWRDALKEAGVHPWFLGVERLIQPDAIPRLSQVIRRSRADVVHAHLEDAATLVPIAARLAGRRSVCTYHHVPAPISGRELLRERLSITMANRSDRVIFVSEASRAGFAERYRASSRWTVVHNGVEMDRYQTSRRPLPADIDVPAGVPVVSIVGHLREGKGHRHAVGAWRTVLGSCPDAHLLLVGDGPLDADLRCQAQTLGVEHRVVFAGRRRDVADLLAGSTLACLPTRREALPTALIEAAASGLPAVASAVSGVLEVVDDGVTGVLVPYADEAALAGAIVGLLNDDDRREAMGRAARLLAEQRFDADLWVERLLALYRSAPRPACRM